ncbi:MAG: hypothetical protein IJS10_01900 [Alphaproteobacteria bacterium]|nr:hypothetical protein [Alphaproteobacteria bacterium]
MRTCKFIVYILAIGCAGAETNFETTADEVEIDTKRGVYYLTGHVKVTIRNRTFKAQKVIIKMNGKMPKEVFATGSVIYTDEQNKVMANRCYSDMNKVKFSQNVSIIRKEFGRIAADYITYNISTKKICIYSENRVRLVLDKRIEDKINQHEIRNKEHN